MFDHVHGSDVIPINVEFRFTVFPATLHTLLNDGRELSGLGSEAEAPSAPGRLDGSAPKASFKSANFKPQKMEFGCSRGIKKTDVSLRLALAGNIPRDDRPIHHSGRIAVIMDGIM